MPLYYFEATRELRTEGYVIADDEVTAKVTSEELVDSMSDGDWEADDSDVYVSEVTDVDKVRKGSYVWAGGPSGQGVSVDEALRILAEENGVLPEIPGQEAFLVDNDAVET